MHGRRTALRYSPSTPSPAGARPRGRSTVLPFGSGVARSIAAWRAGGGAWGGEACSWRCMGLKLYQRGGHKSYPDLKPRNIRLSGHKVHQP